jgi:hypothetical protein
MRESAPPSSPPTSFKQWASAFPGATSVMALVDRFIQHCHVIDIDADCLS